MDEPTNLRCCLKCNKQVPTRSEINPFMAVVKDVRVEECIFSSAAFLRCLSPLIPAAWLMSPLSLSFNVLNERLRARVWQGCWSALPFLDPGRGQITPLVCFGSTLRGPLLRKPQWPCFEGRRKMSAARTCLRACQSRRATRPQPL